jgi:hypothetical protein
MGRLAGWPTSSSKKCVDDPAAALRSCDADTDVVRTMQSSSTMSDAERILSATVTVPPHVVLRSFVNETVLLNLQTGKYHGVNRVGGQMLEELQRGADGRAVAARIARETGAETAVVEADLVAFCRDLSDRGLIELTSRADG